MHDFTFIDKTLYELIIKLKDKINPSEYELLSEFIEVGEEGLCFETICAIISDNEISITEEDYNKIAQIGKVMEIQEKYWLRLKNLGPNTKKKS